MKKFDNFANCFEILKNSRYDKVNEDDIYRMGVIGQFNLCFELSWKALKEVLVLHGVKEGQTGSPREILKLGFSVGFVTDEEIWLDMLKKRNIAIHVYDEENANMLVKAIFKDYIPALERLRDTLEVKIKAAEN